MLEKSKNMYLKKSNIYLYFLLFQSTNNEDSHFFDWPVEHVKSPKVTKRQNINSSMVQRLKFPSLFIKNSRRKLVPTNDRYYLIIIQSFAALLQLTILQ